jgi:hypothetical protein
MSSIMARVAGARGPTNFGTTSTGRATLEKAPRRRMARDLCRESRFAVVAYAIGNIAQHALYKAAHVAIGMIC